MRGIQLLHITDEETEDATVVWSQTLAAQGLGGLRQACSQSVEFTRNGKKTLMEHRFIIKQNAKLTRIFKESKGFQRQLCI